MARPLIAVEKATEGYAVVTFDRPEAMNALSVRLRQQLVETFHAFKDDPAVRVVVLTGSGRAFCAGLDLKEWGGASGAAAGAFDCDPVRAMLAYPGPVIGAINGLTITGGLEIALACDVLIASSDAKFADTHAQAGLLPGWGLSVRLPRIIGIQRAKELSLTGNFISAQHALAWGLVNRVVSPDQLMPEALQLARDMLSAVPATLVAYKKLIDEGFALTFAEALTAERALASTANAAVSREEVERRLEALKARARTRSG